MDFDLLIERKRERFAELEREVADSRLFDNRKRASEIMREHASIKGLLERWTELEAARRQLDDNRELTTSRDVEIAAMADDEIPDLENALPILSVKFKSACFHSTRTKIEMRSWKSAPAPAEAKLQFSPPISTGCTIVTRNQPD